MERLREWFLQKQRALPWREHPTPYRVWVSEVMLQQTRASVVVPYFLAWMDRFPTIKTLAEAPSDLVIKQWEGLGYYSRARNLHRGAQVVLGRFGGSLPSEYAALRQIPGIGWYTAHAIMAFAFHKRAIAVDGNVLRVSARYFGLREDIAKAATARAIQKRLEGCVSPKKPWEIAEALIELGATLCGKSPLCDRCPLQVSCRAYKEGCTAELPIKGKKLVVEQLYRMVAVVRAQGAVLVHRQGAGKVMADLYEFPYFPCKAPWPAERLVAALGFAAVPVMCMDDVVHTFTRYRARLYPWVLEASHCIEVPNGQWVAEEKLCALPFSAGHRRIAIGLPQL